MKFKIIPVSSEMACMESADEGTALCHFATCMESDMSAYFKAIPISEEEFAKLSDDGILME